jgi:hypothetical protein
MLKGANKPLSLFKERTQSLKLSVILTLKELFHNL